MVNKYFNHTFGYPHIGKAGTTGYIECALDTQWKRVHVTQGNYFTAPSGSYYMDTDMFKFLTGYGQ